MEVESYTSGTELPQINSEHRVEAWTASVVSDDA
jgi:hypothetical protein